MSPRKAGRAAESEANLAFLFDKHASINYM